jgi:hypothetical protein
MLLAGNCDGGGKQLRELSLADFLHQPANAAAGYARIADPSLSLHASALDEEVSIRFQTVFLSVDSKENGGTLRETFQFATEAYNNNTQSGDDPRNLILLETSQGLSVQANGRGAKRLLLHGLDSQHSVNEYWLEAERSDHKVRDQQVETAEDMAHAIQRGNSTSEVIGTRSLGRGSTPS